MTIQVYVYPHHGPTTDPHRWAAIALMSPKTAIPVASHDLTDGDLAEEVFARTGPHAVDYNRAFGNHPAEFHFLDTAADLPTEAVFAYIRTATAR